MEINFNRLFSIFFLGDCFNMNSNIIFQSSAADLNIAIST